MVSAGQLHFATTFTCFVLLAFPANHVSASLFTLRSTNNAFWNGTDTWNPVCCPTASDDVLVDLPGSYTVSIIENASIRNVTIGGNSNVSQPILAVYPFTFDFETFHLRSSAALFLGGTLLQRASSNESAITEIYGSLTIPQGYNGVISASKCAIEGSISLADGTALTLSGPGLFTRSAPASLIVGRKNLFLQQRAILSLPNLALGLQAQLVVGIFSEVHLQSASVNNATILVVAGSLLNVQQDLSLTNRSAISVYLGNLNVNNLVIDGIGSFLNIESSTTNFSTLVLENSAVANFVTCTATLEPVYIQSGSHLVVQDKSIVRIGGRQDSARMTVTDSAARGDDFVIVGPAATLTLTQNATMDFQSSSIINADVLSYNSTINVAGTLLVHQSSRFYIENSLAQISGGIVLSNSSFGVVSSKLIARESSDLFVGCSLPFDPPFLGEIPIRTHCELGVAFSEYSVDGNLIVTGQFARFSVLQSVGYVGLPNQPKEFSASNGAIIRIWISTMTVHGSVAFRNSSQMVLQSSNVSLSAELIADQNSGVYVSDNSTVFIDKSLLIGEGSGFFVVQKSVAFIRANVTAYKGIIVADLGGRFSLAGGEVNLLDGASMELRGGGILSGAGNITGNLVNLGGLVTSDPNTRTNITVGNFDSSASANSTLQTTVGTHAGQVVGSTTIIAGSAQLGGTIVVIVSSTLHVDLFSNVSSFPSDGVIIISSANITGDLPALVVQFENGTRVDLSQIGCGYRLQRRETSLALALDVSGCPQSPSTALAASDLPSYIGLLPLWAFILTIVGSVIVVTVSFALLVRFVPALRMKFVPITMLKYRRARATPGLSPSAGL